MQPGGWFDHTFRDGGYLGQFDETDDNIRLGNKTSLVVFSNLKFYFLCFCIIFRISRIYSFI